MIEAEPLHLRFLCILGSETHIFVTWILAQAKIAIVYSRFNKYRSSGTQCVFTLFQAKVILRVNVEYQFAKFQNIEYSM